MHRYVPPEDLILTAEDRILIFAPHPDDEALATGGLLQRAVRAGAIIRIVFATDGENNPWPQRAIEHRWRITAAARDRWGALRRREALQSLNRLWVNPSAVTFLGLPDGGLTDLLLDGDKRAFTRLRTFIDEFRPTLLVGPSLRDIHADHSALAVLVRLAIEGLQSPPERLLEYLVHTRESPGEFAAFSLALSGSEKRAKFEAIACHVSQMVFSHRRFFAYARDLELFDDGSLPTATEDAHPVRDATVHDGALTIRVRSRRQRSLFRESRLHLLLEDSEQRCVHRSFCLPRRSMNGFTEIVVPLGDQPVRRVFVKLAQTRWFRDAAGWREFMVAHEPGADFAFGGETNVVEAPFPSRDRAFASH